ncbi:dephospho-CoA kinase [Aureliella helgolandensis]|uniref:Dephospho-CoA kinase n=1 Tax=Aureliella helgolandensis TaxID=2527968 RepID=A0A518G6Q8_9BACT|nr:dephospho-CoA kinase [Aureliella helgolandensis]QDV24278.1 Dephospho-CoA kinase [Aureliella helgolandensis]
MRLNPTKKRPFVVGFVGGIAAGKTHFGAALESLGAVRIDADAIGHRVLQDPAVQSRLCELFGDAIVRSDGTLDRKALAACVFGDTPVAKAAKLQLEELVHPRIHALAVAKLQEYQAACEPPVVVVIDAPLLLEAGWAPYCDAIIFIETPFAVRARRALERGWTETHLRDREASQLPLNEKRKQATHVVSGQLDESQVAAYCEDLVAQIEMRSGA